MIMNIDSNIKERAKEQRLTNLKVQYFEFQMNLAAYEANNDQAGIEQTKQQMESCEKSYKAIEAIPTE
jgi:hypothetical protein